MAVEFKMRARNALQYSGRLYRSATLVAALFGFICPTAIAEQTPGQKAALEAAQANVGSVYWTLETDPPILRNIYLWSSNLFTVIHQYPELRAEVDRAITEIITDGGRRPASEYDGMPTRFSAIWYMSPYGRELVPPPRISAVVLTEAHPLIEFEAFGLHYCFYFIEGRLGQWPFDLYATLMGMYQRRLAGPFIAAIIAAELPVLPMQLGHRMSGTSDTYEVVRRALRRLDGYGARSMDLDMKLLSFDLRRVATTGFVIDTFEIVENVIETGPGPRHYRCLVRSDLAKQRITPVRAVNLDPTDNVLIQLK